MKIWDASKGETKGVIYDTQPGAPDWAVLTTPLGVGLPGVFPPPGGGAESRTNKGRQTSLMLLDGVFASELDWHRASQAPQLKALTPVPVGMPLAAREAEILLHNRQPLVATGMVRRIFMAHRNGNWLDNGIEDALWNS